MLTVYVKLPPEGVVLGKNANWGVFKFLVFKNKSSTSKLTVKVFPMFIFGDV